MITYQSCTEEFANGPLNCNSNNHDITDMNKYNEQLALTYKCNWVKYFPDPVGSHTITLTQHEHSTLKNACSVGTITGYIPESILEDLESISKKLSFVDSNPSIKWFVRVDGCSPKDSIVGCGPFNKSYDILRSLVTSMRVYLSLKYDTCNLYLVPWNDSHNVNNEFRVFVHNRKITAISQYHWYSDIGLNEEKLSLIAPMIVSYCNNAISQVPFIDCTIDVSVIDNVVSLIEFNCFGKNLAAGSCCFHWINDESILYGDGSIIVVKYVHG